uniref:Myb/SANT-like domain-containing protein n=1 Tax=Lactuca sativa TaxID=4236 RepID=A0A9R1XVC2_LACSA|nr:hypothetical protein LSAT_V11C100049290 [Lactuca sativa]
MERRNKHTWTIEEDVKLIEALLELHVSEKYGGVDNGFKPSYLKAVRQLLDVSIPNSGLKAEPHIKSRMKTWKNHFNIMHDMVYGTNMSGFGWDTDKCCVTADAETQRNSLVDVEGLKDIVKEMQQIARGNSKRKRPPTDDTESSYKEAGKEMKEAFKEVGEKLNGTIYNIGRQENKEACDMFSKDQFRAQTFFKMT